ncbi:MAG TPA: pantetheine-phosphate adenylyltransferase [Patescibacteria group bacterium]|nr:pantetheine-phosphate adenylyltransferase [Patescibacteria group bacterium]
METQTKKYTSGILGGTFDHLHAGHRHFLNTALAQSEHLTIGLTANEFSRGKQFSISIEDYEKRHSTLRNFLDSSGHIDRYEIIEINDPFGTSITNPNIDAIFVTEHGASNAKLINEKRHENGLNTLPIEHVDFLTGPDEKTISSTRIRAGEIDRIGNPYITIFDADLALPTDLRDKTSKIPAGDLVRDNNQLKEIAKSAFYLVAVGDVSSEKLTELGRQADVSIVDGQTKRGAHESRYFSLENGEGIKNTAGTVSREAALKYQEVQAEFFENKQPEIFVIDGEEDLMPLPITLLAPLRTTLVYGMPDQGAVVVKIDETTKKSVVDLLAKFQKQN